MTGSPEDADMYTNPCMWNVENFWKIWDFLKDVFLNACTSFLRRVWHQKEDRLEHHKLFHGHPLAFLLLVQYSQACHLGSNQFQCSESAGVLHKM